MALLSGARNERNVEVSKQVFESMEKLFPELKDCLVPASILLANVYASSGHLDEANVIRMRLNEAGLRKQAGASWTAVKGKLWVCIIHHCPRQKLKKSLRI